MIAKTHTTKPIPVVFWTPRPLSEAEKVEGLALTAHTRRPGAHPLWPHMLTDTPFVEPAAPNHPRVEAWLKKHPFKPVPKKPMKRTVLRKEAFKVYKAIAFAMQHHGIVLNAHLTILWGYLGVADGAQAAWLLTRFNHEAAKWLKVGFVPGVERKRRGQRVGVEGSEHMYVYVHEWGRRQGLHTHELAFIPPEKKQQFEIWARSCLARLCGRDHIPLQALKITGGNWAAEHRRVWLCWNWFRYITKTLDPAYSVLRKDGAAVQVRDIFRPRWFYEGAGVTCDQLASGSRNIWTQAQKEAGFLARVYQPGVVDIYDGAELDEHRWALVQAAEDAKRAEFIRGLDTLNL